MRHPFRIGEIYENNKGAYNVLELAPPKMRIKYENGEEGSVNIERQVRILEQIQIEQILAEEEQVKRNKVKRYAITFSGLEESDFKDNVAGTTWRSREGLGGLVSQQLSDKSGKEFNSVAIYRRPHFFVYPPSVPMINQAEGVKSPKFIVELNPDVVFYGFYIEKSDKSMEAGWCWPNFLNMLLEPGWQEAIEQMMVDHGLSWVLKFEEQKVSTGEYVTSDEVFVTSFDNGERFPTFSDFVEYLHNLPPEQWCNLYLAKTIDKGDAIEMKAKVSEPISHAFNLMVPMYFRSLQL